MTTTTQKGMGLNIHEDSLEPFRHMTFPPRPSVSASMDVLGPISSAGWDGPPV